MAASSPLVAALSKWAPSAQLAYTLGVRAGLTPQQATDFAAVQYGESGFNPNAVNKSSGAAGLYQLLSSGYVNRARALGGVLNPTANIKAILPNYAAYYRAHPQFVPGAAGAAVEASGEPASYYAAGWQHLGSHGVPGSAGAGAAAVPAQAPVSGAARHQPDLLGALVGRTNALLGLGGGGRLAGLLNQSSHAAAPTVGAAPQIHPTASPAGHLANVDGIQVDAAYAPLVAQLAARFHVTPTSGYRDPAHNRAVGGAPNSDHLRGDAVDFGGNPAAVRALYQYALSRFPYVEPLAQAKNHAHISFARP